MKKSLGLSLLAIATCFGFVQETRADEVWRTEEFNAVYKENRGDTAIWEYGNGFGTVFLDGLATEDGDRGTYYGYWVQTTSSKKCDTFREGADGQPTYHWGTVKVEFIDPDFPSRWKLSLGICDGERIIDLNGTPVIE